MGVLSKLLISAAGVQAATLPSTSGITKIITMLSEMKKQAVADSKDITAQFNDRKNENVKASTTYEKDISYATEKRDEAQACSEDNAGKQSALLGENAQLAEKTGSAGQELQAATASHKEAAAADTTEKASLHEDINMLAKASAVLERVLGGGGATALIQQVRSGKLSKGQTNEIQMLLTGLAAITDAGNVFTQGSQVSNFLSEVSSGLTESDSLKLSFSQQPQVATSNYESKSGGILDEIQKMHDKATKNLNALVQDSLARRHAFELLHQQLTSSMEKWGDQMAKNKELAEEAGAKGGECESTATAEASALKTSQSELKKEKHAFGSYTEDYEKRLKDLTDEASVLDTAVGILSGKFGGDSEESKEALVQKPSGFLQVRRITKHRQHNLSLLAVSTDSSAMAKKSNFSNQLYSLGQKFNSFKLLQASQQMNSEALSQGVFDKILKMVNDMIVKLEEEQAAEAAHHADCEGKKEKGAKMTKAANNKFNKLTARSDKNGATLVKTQAEMEEATAAKAANEDILAKKGEERTAESEENAKIVKECTEAESALTEAIKVLSEFYGDGSNDKAQAIIDILETSQMDYNKLNMDTQADESQGQNVFNNFKQEKAIKLSELSAQIQGKKNHIAEVTKQININADDLQAAQGEVEAAGAFTKATNEACAVKVMSFEEKQAKRAAEIDGLKTALDILNEETSGN